MGSVHAAMHNESNGNGEALDDIQRNTTSAADEVLRPVAEDNPDWIHMMQTLVANKELKKQAEGNNFFNSIK